MDPYPYNPASKYPGADDHDFKDLPFVGAQPGTDFHNSEYVGTDMDPER